MEMVLPLSPTFFQTQSPTNANDEALLIERARVGEIGALDELMNRHRSRVLNLTFQITRDRDLAEDCAQEAFVRAFSKLNLFRAQSSFATWLYRIALNVALEKGRAPLLPITELDEQTHAPPTDFDNRMALEWALDQLSSTLRVALILREWHGLSYDEMASVCEVPVGTIRSRLSAARAEFQRVWTQVEAQ